MLARSPLRPGAGIWVIDGDAEFGGNFNYAGIIIVTGQVYYRGGGGRTFLGAIVSGATTIDNFDVNGNASIKYSSAAVSAAKNAAAKFSMVSWEQINTK